MIDTKTLVLKYIRERELMKIEYDFDGVIRDESIVIFHGFGDLFGKTHWGKADLMIWLSLKSYIDFNFFSVLFKYTAWIFEFFYFSLITAKTSSIL